jgi:hypothetical protein
VIKTLVSIEVDLAASLAIRFACHMGSLVEMEIHPLYVKESASHDSAMGAGWASRTWERQMIEEGRAEIAEIIASEQDFCPLLKEPRVIYGDREAELLRIVQTEGFDLYVEGAHFAWNPHEIYKKFHSKLYQHLPTPSIMVRALRKVGRAVLLCLDVRSTEILTATFQRFCTSCSLPLLLIHPAKASDGEADTSLRKAVDSSCRTLADCGYQVSIADTLSRTPHPGALDALGDHGLVAMAAERGIRKDSVELQWLTLVNTSALLAFQNTGRNQP